VSGGRARYVDFVARRGPDVRKHYWLPCALGATFDDKTPAEQQAILKATKWADLITNAEWPVMLQDVRNPPVRSRLKRKIVHWLMAMGRIAALNPQLYNQAVAEARALYREQIGKDHPMFAPPEGGER
jgi:hypothetical protein